MISVLSVDANGRAVLDLDKNPGADDPASLGISDAERATLAARYAPGTSLWRVRMQHFSLWDINWGWGPDDDARPPDQSPPTPHNPPDQGPPCEAGGSVIECESRVLREHIAIAATPYELVYSSARQAGSARELRIPITVNPPPSSVRSVVLAIEVGGRTQMRSFTKAPDQTYTFEWDGKDAAGRLRPSRAAPRSAVVCRRARRRILSGHSRGS